MEDSTISIRSIPGIGRFPNRAPEKAYRMVIGSISEVIRGWRSVVRVLLSGSSR
jgi:hypothetical protein